MKTSKILKSTWSILILVLLIFVSCTEENIEQESNALEQEEQVLEITPIVQKLLDMGYKLKNIIEIDDFFVVEGDLLFSKNIKDYPETNNTQARHYYTGQTVSNSRIGNLLVFSGISETGPQTLPNNNEGLWRDAVDEAIEEWNTISDESCIRFNLTDDINIAHIRIMPINNSSFNGLGVTHGFPNNMPPQGEPFPLIEINMSYNNGTTSFVLKKDIIAHELGHAIHLRHTDVVFNNGDEIPGTETSTDSFSIMIDGSVDFPGDITILNRPIPIGFFTNDDVANVNTLYGGCTDISINLTLDGPSIICSNSNAVTFSLPSGETANDWAVTSELNTLSETSTSVTVKPINNGQSSQATISALDASGNVIASKTITIDGGPTPIQPPSITGPSLLKSYQVGSFYTSNTNFNNYTNVEWVIFSYAFPNAGQHFNIQNANNNDFHAFAEVLPSAPSGTYTIQCRVSNNCGTYYIDKTFNVKKGKPQIYDEF